MHDLKVIIARNEEAAKKHLEKTLNNKDESLSLQVDILRGVNRSLREVIKTLQNEIGKANNEIIRLNQAVEASKGIIEKKNDEICKQEDKLFAIREVLNDN